MNHLWQRSPAALGQLRIERNKLNQNLPNSPGLHRLIVPRYRVSIYNFMRVNASLVFTALVFLGFVLAINWEVFRYPQIEWGDVAANALQVENAKHFRELLGNYSRWHFHHPGPFFFYLFAAGEGVFYNLLHIVPAPLNGECLAEIIFSVSCLFGSIYIFAIQTRRALFLPLAVLASVLFLYTLESAVPASAVVSLWPPYMGLFSFLLLTVSSASVAAGRWTHLPLMTFSGMVMTHAHVAQMLFVTALISVALAWAFLRDFRAGKLAENLVRYRPSLIASLVIVVLFAFPLLIELLVHKPNNLTQIRAYLVQHRGEHNSLRTAILYLFSFLTYNTTPDTVLTNRAAGTIDLLNPEFFVRLYWSISSLIAILAAFSLPGRVREIPVFLRLVFGEIIFIALLFVYWSWRITGPMYLFNGYFFFSVQLLALFGFVALIARMWETGLDQRKQMALACGFCSLVLLVPGLKQGRIEWPEVVKITDAILVRRVQSVMLTFQPAEWPVAAGVASLLNRAGVRFCVDTQFEFMLGHACRNADDYYRVVFTQSPLACASPCQKLYAQSKLYVTGKPE